MFQLVKREISAERKSICFWLLGFGFFMAAGLAKSNGIVDSTDSSMSDLIANFPPIVSAMYGFSGLDLTTFEGYFGVMQNFALLIAGIHAVIISFKIFAIEEIDKTYEYIYAKPISREKIVVSKVIAIFIIVLILNIGLLIINYLSVLPNYANSNEYISFIFINNVHTLMLQLFFVGISLIFVSLIHGLEGSTKLGTLALLGFYFMGVISDLLESTKFLQNFTPFRFLDTLHIINDDVSNLSYLVCLGIFALGCGLVVYLKPKQEVVLS